MEAIIQSVQFGIRLASHVSKTLGKADALAKEFVLIPLQGLAPWCAIEDQAAAKAAMDMGSGATVGADSHETLGPLAEWLVLVCVQAVSIQVV